MLVCCLFAFAPAGFAAPIPGLFNTGVGTNGAVLATGAVDPHYKLVQSADASFPGPNAIVVNDQLFPIVAGPWLATTPVSKWIGPQANQSTGNQFGDYYYRVTFDLTGFDASTVTITGRWSSDNAGSDILLNGVATGNSNPAQFAGWTTFTISAADGDAFIEGTNTIDFIVNNAGTTVNPTGFRAEFTSATADPVAPPGTPPSIISHPQSRIASLGDTVRFTVIAGGARPLSYQWRFNGGPLSGATSNSFTVAGVTTNNAGAYDVVVSNPWGSVTSRVATLKTIFRLGPSSRRTGLVISEIMYHPRDRADGKNLEFVEIHNSNPFEEDLSGYRLTGDWDFTIPDNTFIPGDGFLVIAAAPVDVQSVYGIGNVLGGFTNTLPNDSGTVRLRKRSNAIVLEVNYSDGLPWPVAPDGTGHSLVLTRPWLGERNPQAWSSSALIGGSPGSADPPVAGPLENVVINEILAHTDDPIPDFVELYNHSSNTIDLSGCFLSDAVNTNKFQIPNGTLLGPSAAIAFDQTQLGFAFSAEGEDVYFVNPAQTRVIDAVRFGGQARNIAYGRFPDGAPTFHELLLPTRGTNNAPLLIRDIVINEIMYHPISGLGDDEYLELYNRGAGPVNLGGWRFIDGIDFAIPAGVIIPASGYLVVAKNATRLMTNYPGLHSGNVVGNFSGRLDDGGERIALTMPETRFTTNQSSGAITTNTYYVVVDEVTYVDGGRWGKWSDGGGSSLELIDPRSDNRLAANWADSDESAKAGWTLVEQTGLLDLGSGVADRLDVMIQGAGEALIDDIEVIPPAGGNLVANPGFEGGTANWILQGTHMRSFRDTTGGYNSANSLHLIATERGDHVANHARAILNSALPINTNATIRARVRWLHGHPEVLLRLKGGYLEAVGRLAVPVALGTPGARNSRAMTNAGPAIIEVKHAPALPKTNEPIRVTARVHDPDGIQSVTLLYRIDPSATVASIPLLDNGSGPDEVARDGIFSGVIPGQLSGTLVAFYVEAADSLSPSIRTRFPSDAPARECLVRVGETMPSGAFGTYRLWFTAAANSAWTARPIMSNEDADTTFVYGTNAVVYNVGAHFSGSSYTAGCYTSPAAALSGYDLNFPEDEALLGETHFTLDWLIRDDTGQREQLQYWLLEQYSLPNMYRRYVHMIVNGVHQSARSTPCGGSTAIYEDVQQPGGETIEEWFSNDSEGDLYKTDCWDEFSDAGVRETSCIALNTLQNFTTTGGVRKVARYRWNWRPRAIDGTANDFSTLFDLVDAVNAPVPGYQSAVECLVDVPHWMRTFAMNDISSFWDAFGNPNGKNTYLYKPEHEGWKLMCWDFDVGLGVFNDPVDAPLFAANDANVSRIIPQTPGWTRLYWCALDEALNGFFRVGSGTAIDRLLDAKYAAFVGNGIPLNSPDAIKTWINGRRAFLQTQLNTVAATFTVAGPTSITTGTNLVTLTGTAPVTVHGITVNGRLYPITWTTVNAWRMTVPVTNGTTVLAIQGLDRLGNSAINAAASITVNYTGTDVLPQDSIVINEIMYNPVIPESSFIELFNTSSNYSFDISGWQINGMGFRFPPGTVISNRQFIVVTKNRAAFGTAYGWNIPVLCEFDGQLDDGGETLTLIRPGPTAAEDLVVDRVTYDDDSPWPASADGQGYSLQLIDPAQDNDRVSNWTDGQGWRFFSFTRSAGSSTANRMSMFFAETTGGDLYLDDMSFVAGTVPGAGPNLIANGGFESQLSPPWMFGTLATNSAIATDVVHSGSNSLHLIVNPGTIALNTFYQDMSPVTTGTVYTFSFWFLAGHGTNFRARLSANYDATANVRPARSTPGTNNATPIQLPPFPLLWLSEVQPSPAALDNRGDAEPWIELYLGGASPVLPLDGYFLADNFVDLTQWPFPSGTSILPNQHLLVWADAEPSETTAADLHTSFRLTPGTGTVVLSRMANGAVQIVDYLNYRDVGTNQSFGTYPPGQSSFRRVFDYPTPRATNDPTRRPVPVYINEWMASNSGAVQDPFDRDYEDWFELYNAGSEAVDLSGYKLTDRLAISNMFTIPDGFVIPARGFLLVWADAETGQSRTNGDLHVNFRLSAGGEAIGLFEPGERMVDSVTFEQQTNNVSQGRFPDGAPGPYPYMTTFTPRAPNTVAPPSIEILEINVGPAAATLTWRSRPGGIYRVQYKAALDAPSWIDLPNDVSATGDSVSSTDTSINGVAQRFYRIQLLP